jgi:hypothetical protein
MESRDSGVLITVSSDLPTRPDSRDPNVVLVAAPFLPFS